MRALRTSAARPVVSTISRREAAAIVTADVSKRIVVLDDDEDLRLSLADAIRLFAGLDCVALGSYADLLSQSDDVLGCALAILDVNLGAGMPSGLDAYQWLCDHDYRGQIVFLTGHAWSHPLVAAAGGLRGARVVQKPMSVDALRALLASA
jgi:FixJ family two-component response regulator